MKNFWRIRASRMITLWYIMSNFDKIETTSAITTVWTTVFNIVVYSFLLNPLIMFCVINAVLIGLWVRHRLTFWKRQGVVNLVGYTYKAFASVIAISDIECVRKHGKIIGTYELIWPTLLVAEPELINQILVKNFREYSSHRVWALPDQPIGKSLFMLTYEPWKVSRSIISPAFTMVNMKKMKYVFEESMASFVANLDKRRAAGNPVDMKPLFESLTMDVLTSAFFATKVDSANDPNNLVVTNSRKLFSGDLSLTQMIAIFSPLMGKLFGFRAFNKECCDFLMTLSRQIVEERKSTETKRNDLIQYMLDAEVNNFLSETYENNSRPAFNRRRNSAPVILSTIHEYAKSATKKEGLTTEEIVHNTVMFFMAAFDTTTATLCNLIYMLTVNTEVQAKLADEIDEWAAKHGGVNYESLASMPYLEACINESLRVLPSVPRIERKTPDDCYLGDLFVPKNTCVSIAVHAVHHDPDNYADPELFMPERFLADNRHKIKPGTYIPFADGPRNCIGMRFAMTEIKHCVATILHGYRLEPCAETTYPEFFSGQPISMPKRVMVRVVPRHLTKNGHTNGISA